MLQWEIEDELFEIALIRVVVEDCKFKPYGWMRTCLFEVEVVLEGVKAIELEWDGIITPLEIDFDALKLVKLPTNEEFSFAKIGIYIEDILFVYDNISILCFCLFFFVEDLILRLWHPLKIVMRYRKFFSVCIFPPCENKIFILV